MTSWLRRTLFRGTRIVWIAIAASATLVVLVVVIVVGGTVLRIGGFGGTGAAEPVVPIAPVSPPGDLKPYMAAMRVAAGDGLNVWIETDLVKRWRAGPAAFQDGIAALAQEARVHGVVGIKIADELGYHDGLSTPAEIDAFLDATATALRAVAPGKKILADLVIPALGCLPGYQPPVAAAASCAATAQRQYPQLALAQIDGYVARHDIDVMDVSTGLLAPETYADWGVPLEAAQTAAWQAISERGWSGSVVLNARKALAHPGADTESSAEAATGLWTFLDIPRQYGAVAADVWTWRQFYQGQIYRLLDPGLKSNPLWSGLVARRQTGVRLYTHFSPHSVEVSLDADIALLATAFTDVFMAAGTG